MMRLLAIVVLAAFAHVTSSIKFINRIVESPSITCDTDYMIIKVKTSTSNPSKIYVDDYADDKDCMSRNKNRLSVELGKCGMTTDKTDDSRGLVYRVCISVQLHPLFVTANDHSYCAQCVYMPSSDLVEDLDETLAISDPSATELPPEFDSMSSRPKCTYAIKRSLKGPKVHYAVVGETVFHVWECQVENVKILVQNCYVEDGQGNRILIIDDKGCGVDEYILQTPKYAKDLKMAYQETPVFKFADKTLTRFGCQIRICSNKEKCEITTPPRDCPTYEDRLATQRKLRDEGIPEVGKEGSLKLLFHPYEVKKQSRPSLHDQKSLSRRNQSAQMNKTKRILANRRRPMRVVRAVVNPNTAPSYSSDGVYVHDSEVDVAGVLTILDTPEDVKFFEESLDSKTTLTCLSRSSYVVLILLLVVFCFLHLLIGILCASNFRYFKKIINNRSSIDF